MHLAATTTNDLLDTWFIIGLYSWYNSKTGLPHYGSREKRKIFN
jgi:hypothetical protein